MDKKISFEENMKELRRIVAELEKGDLPLEKAVSLYGDGVSLSAECRKLLSEAQLKIAEDKSSAADSEEK